MALRGSLSVDTFDLDEFYVQLGQYPLETAQGRLDASYADPLAFALIYMSHHLQAADGSISFADSHLEWVEQAKGWMTPGPSRDAYIAPRSMGKSTWWFLILPLWAACFGHRQFAAAFADNALQAQSHLATFRSELASNQQLRDDFPLVTNPLKRNGRAVVDNEAKYKSESGFVFVAKGIDSSSLGLKDGQNRPDLIILDDIEPDESNYTIYQKDKRLISITDSIFYLNLNAKVVISGTVTMAGSIIHDLVKANKGDVAPWVEELNPPIHIHHHLPIITNEDGSQRSIWPDNSEQFDLEKMKSIENTASFLKNFMNSPLGSGGDLWQPSDFVYADIEVGSLLLSIDPAVTAKRSSDLTGMALMGLSKKEKKVMVLDVWQKRWTPDQIRKNVNDLIDNHAISTILIETNQGGDIWKTILEGVEAKVVPVHQNLSKELRAQRAHVQYNNGNVVHQKRLPALEEQMVSFPKGVHDDMVDAVVSGIIYFLNLVKVQKKIARTPRAANLSYL